MAYVIIGNSAAGVAAAERVRQIDKNGKIIIISDEPHAAYSRCLTSYYLAGRVQERDMYLRPGSFYEKLGIDFYPGQRVTVVDPDGKEVTTEQGMRFTYAKLLLATGASPVVPDIPGIHAGGVFTLRTLADAKNIEAACSNGGRAVILGGGLVSLKTAAALRDRGMNVTVLVSSNRVMSRTLAETAAGLVEEQLVRIGIKVKKNTRVISVESDSHGRVTGVKLANGEIHPADLVVVGKGVRPNTGLIKDTGLVGEAGEAVRVNRRQETDCKDIYAAGDAALTYNILEEKYSYNAIWPNAVEQGAVAGTNMAGVPKEYPGSIAMNSASFGGVPVMTAGITRPGEQGFEVFEERDAGSYRMLVLKEGRLVGYTLFGDTSRAGLYTGIIKSGKQFISNQALWQKPRRFVTLANLGSYL